MNNEQPFVPQAEPVRRGGGGGIGSVGEMVLVLFSIALALAMLFTSGCTTTPPKVVVRTDTIEVPRYIKQPVTPELTAPIVVDEPKATCNDGTGTVFCEDEIKLDRLLLKAAVDQCNRDRKTIRDGQGDKPC